MQLYDNHGRIINYLRLAVTDRCNLRCFYCMPEEGIKYVEREELLTYEEMERVIRLLVRMGISKLRITGGEPFVRKDMLPFLERIRAIEGLDKINITTNGTITADIVADLVRIGIDSVNLSLDTLDRQRFLEITRRDVFDKVMDTYHALLKHHIPTKINAVVMAGKNTDDIIPMAELTKKHPVSVRFIEEMPFNGAGSGHSGIEWNYRRILQQLQTAYPNLEKLPDPPHSTALTYKVPGHQGSIGIIPAYSRTFCGSCNRIRLTPKGLLKTCLYDNGVFNVRDLLRAGATDEQVQDTFLEAFRNRAKDGWEAEQQRGGDLPVKESMSTIGG